MVSLSPAQNTNYYIGDPQLNWSLEVAGLTTQSPACGYQEMLSVSFAPKLRSTDSFTWTFSETSIDF